MSKLTTAAAALAFLGLIASSNSASAWDKECTLYAIGERTETGAHPPWLTCVIDGVYWTAYIDLTDKDRAARYMNIALAALLSGRPIVMDTGSCAAGAGGGCKLVALGIK